jgi:hypothetical protein
MYLLAFFQGLELPGSHTPLHFGQLLIFWCPKARINPKEHDLLRLNNLLQPGVLYVRRHPGIITCN